jgi:hypothetical protein
MIVVGGADGPGRIWATQLTGAPGFPRVPEPRTLVIDALPLPEDPFAGVLTSAAPAGARGTGGPVRVGMIATASGRGDAEASHRGGKPGFVTVVSPTLLRRPAYTGTRCS